MDAQPATPLRSLTLTVTERCNLRCSYCRVPVERGRDLSPELADAAVDLLARQASGDGVTLSFYGGEPTLAFDTVLRSVRRARRALGRGRRLRVLMPTNGLQLDGRLLEACREQDIELAISLDGEQGPCERLDADGRASTGALLLRVPAVLAAAPRSLARMTVTPANVEHLAGHVKAVARLGFRRIHIQPALEPHWSEAALSAWAREHQRIGCWLSGARAAGLSGAELPSWNAIVGRLAHGRPKRWCGAGSRLAAVGPDGGLHACYRLVFHPDPAWRLGHVEGGLSGQALGRLAAFDPERLSPEDGNCERCEARHGCTLACPALGIQLAGDPAHVPALACQLMRAQVQAVREQLDAGRGRRLPRRGPGRARIAAAALAAATLGVAATNCSSSVEVGHGGHDAGSGGGGSLAVGGAGGAVVNGGAIGYGGALDFDAGTGGICDDPWDAGGGICPDSYDGGSGAWGGGLC